MEDAERKRKAPGGIWSQLKKGRDKFRMGDFPGYSQGNDEIKSRRKWLLQSVTHLDVEEKRVRPSWEVNGLPERQEHDGDKGCNFQQDWMRGGGEGNVGDVCVCMCCVCVCEFVCI